MGMDYDEMTNDELRSELEARGLKTSGNKDDLVARLELNDAERDDATDAPEQPEAEAEKETVEAGADADAEAVAEANADVNKVVDRGAYMGDPAKGDFTTPGDVSKERDGDLEFRSGTSTRDGDPPANRGTVMTGAEVRGRLVPEGGEELEPMKVSASRMRGLRPQSRPENLSPEVSGYIILPDGRRQPIELVEDE